ncbi:HPP family protein [Undibacterium sp. RuRC25W]|uniref:HPP family protein n=1 Tax=Undibacterium sp. RuRC25W TaxID=3413047 RepID=UPI003BF0A044
MRNKWSHPKSLLSWFKSFSPARLNVDRQERLRSCCGMFIGLVLTGVASKLMIGSLTNAPMLLGPLGASAVLLFGVPASPLAQPWSAICGNLVSAVIGVTCVQFFGVSIYSAAIASSLAVATMFALRCLHPPGGAVALTAVLGGPVIVSLGYDFVLFPVLVNTILLLALALVYNNLTGRPYPHISQPDHKSSHATSDGNSIDRIGFNSTDLDNVLKKYNQVLDISRDDLENLFMQTEMHAYRRRFGEITCRDVMSKDVITAEFGTSLEDAWKLLREHRIKVLPIVDIARHVIGIVTLVDFMKHANLDIYATFDDKLRRLIRRTVGMSSNKPEVAGQIMTKNVRTVQHDFHIVELVPLLSDQGLHHIPIVDNENKLVGIVTQSDLIAALYRGQLTDNSFQNPLSLVDSTQATR